MLGYDAGPHVDYLIGLIERGAFPDGTGEYYTPPAFYALAGVVWKIGGVAGLDEPLRLVQRLLSGAFAVGTAVLLLEFGQTVRFPIAGGVHLCGLAFFIGSAIVVRDGRDGRTRRHSRCSSRSRHSLLRPGC